MKRRARIYVRIGDWVSWLAADGGARIGPVEDVCPLTGCVRAKHAGEAPVWLKIGEFSKTDRPK